MAVDLTLKPLGLITDPAPTSSAPDGALRVASNVVIQRQGIVEPRPGFKDALAGLVLPNNVEARFAVPFDDDLLIWGFVTTSSQWRIYRASDLGLVSSGVTPPDPNRRRTKSAEARANLYFTTTLGVMKLTGASATATLAGLRPPRPMAQFTATLQQLVTGAGITGALLPGHKTALRLVLRRQDANDYIIRSYPSSRTYVTNSTTQTKNIAVGVVGITNPQVGDVVEVYRALSGTPASTFVPDDTMYLSKEYALVASDLAALAAAAPPNEKLTIIDDAPPGFLGAELYTNPSQQGLEKGKRPAPLAREVCAFRGSTFYFDIQSPHRAQIRVTKVSGNTIGGFYSSSLTGIQARRINGDAAAGSFTLQNLTSMNGLAIGMGVALTGNVDGPRSADAVFPAHTLVASLGASRVRITAAALSTTTGTSLTMFERIQVGGVNVYGHLTNNAPQRLGFWTAGPSAGTPTVSYARVATDFAKAFNTLSADISAEVIEDEGGAASNILLERNAARDLAFSIQTSRAGAFSPVITSPMLSESDIQPGGFAWSEPDEPEAVPIANYGFVGDPKKRTLRAVPTRDVLWVFKEDGLFALTGNSAEGEAPWRVDPIDPTFQLVAPDSCAVMDEKVYCLSDAGVVALSQGGAEALSEPFVGVDFAPYTASLLSKSASAHVPFGIADHVRHRYLLGLGTAGASGARADLIYVWSEKTRSWTTWALGPKHGVMDPASDTLALVHTGTFTLRRSRRGDEYDLADLSYVITVTSNTASIARIRFNPGSGWSPQVGDLVSAVVSVGDVTLYPSAHVDSVLATTIVSLTTSLAPYTTGAATAWTGFESQVEWTTRAKNNPDVSKAWQDAALHFLDVNGLEWAQIRTRSNNSFAHPGSTQTLQISSLATTAPLAARFFVPREHNYSTDLFVKLVIKNAGAEWKAAELAISGEPVSLRTRRGF